MQKQISNEQALKHLIAVKHLPMNRAWRGYGSAIFFELGELDKEGAGDFTLTVSQDWLLEGNNLSLDAGADFSEIDDLLQKAKNKTIEKISIDGDELLFVFGDLLLRINLNKKNNSEWSLSPVEEAFLTTANGSFVIEKEG